MSNSTYIEMENDVREDIGECSPSASKKAEKRNDSEGILSDGKKRVKASTEETRKCVTRMLRKKAKAMRSEEDGLTQAVDQQWTEWKLRNSLK